jgi:ABC-type antimicrobial peptide transport system permease subunit
MERPFHNTSWYAIVEDSSLRFSQSLSYTRQMVRLESSLLSMLPKGSVDYSPLDMLKAYESRLETMIVLFYAAGAPVLALALFFIWLTASIATRQHEQETAVLGARGGSKGSILLLNLVESGVLIVLVLPLALLTGRAAAILMGQTQLFLQFVHRTGIDST